ncbi:hypothetical protein, partial [Ureibacillus manganicus]|uniref:hypothetical protein n=1 Tax=Ureibacillus manganicus TaxID=1266064 RepID=UPI001B803A37
WCERSTSQIMASLLLDICRVLNTKIDEELLKRDIRGNTNLLMDCNVFVMLTLSFLFGCNAK